MVLQANRRGPRPRKSLASSSLSLLRRQLGWVISSRLGVGWLFAAALVPGIVAGSILFHDSYQSQRAHLEQGALQTARALSLAIDRDLAGIRAKVDILAASPYLKNGDLETFYERAQDVVATEKVAVAVVLIDESGQQILNTLRPFGSPLPMTGHPDLVRRTFESGRPLVSDLYLGGVTKRPFVALEMPVRSNGKIVYALDMGIPAERLSQLLVAQQLPAGWVASLIDSQGVVIARSLNAAQYVGQKARSELLEAMAASPEGALGSQTLEGLPSFVAFTRSDPSGWTVAVGMTRSILDSGVHRSLALAILTITAFLVGGASLAWLFSRQIRDALLNLQAATEAAALGDLEAMAPCTGPREIARLAERFNTMQEARRDAEARLRLSASVFSAASEAIVIVGADARIMDVNHAFTVLTGYARGDALGRNPRFLRSDRHAPDFYDAIEAELAASGCWQGEVWARRKGGEAFAAYATLTVVRDQSGAVSHYIALFSDITALRRQQEEIQRLAYYDPLTGLPNRRLLSDRIQQALSLAARSNAMVAVCYLDLDDFKPINDTYGHAVGDRLIVEVARRLEGVVRSQDTVSRLGGDEFVLLLTELRTHREAEIVLGRVLQVICEPFAINGSHAATISASIGIAFCPEDGTDADVLLRHSDQAMYQAKREGRNRTRKFQPESPGPAA